MDRIVASDEQICRAANGRVFTLTVLVGQPFQEADGVWACPVFVEGLDGKERLIHGEYSLQSLGLALSYVRTLLRGFAESGGLLFDPETNETFSMTEHISSMFGSTT
jgi:hypothetical protein